MKQYRYRVTFHDQNGQLLVMRGLVPAKFDKETDRHIRSRIGLDLLSKAEFSWVEYNPPAANGKAVA